MPRYFFNVHDGTTLPDNEGTELAGIDAARGTAAKLAGKLLHDDPNTFWSGEEWHMDVQDERGLILFSLHFLAVDAPVLVRDRGSTPDS